MNEAPQGANRKLLLAYAESSCDLAAPLQKAFEAAGFDVASCTDARPTGPEATDVAVAVVVCWTPAAVASDVVNLQAARAQKARKLAPVLLAPCNPPANLGRPLADLSGWRGDATDLEFLRLVHALHARLTKRMFSSDFWRSRYLSWGGLGAASLGAIAIIANLGDLRQTIDGIANPAASQRDLDDVKSKVQEVVTLLKQKSGQTLSSDAEFALSQSIEQLLSVQSGARGAAARKLENGDVEGALADLNRAAQEGEKAAAGLSQTWQEIGALHYFLNTEIAIDAYQRAVDLTPHDSSALYQLGSLLVRNGALVEGETVFKTLRMLAVEEGEENLTAAALGYLGRIARTRDDLEAAQKYFQQALDLDEANGNLQGQANNLGDLGEVARMQADYAVAETYFHRSLALFQQAGDRENEGVATSRLGALARDRKRYDEADKLYMNALAIADESGDREGRAYAYAGLGDTALDRGRLNDALSAYRESYKAAQEFSANESRAVALVGLADVSERMGDKAVAKDLLVEALTTYHQMYLDDEVDRLDARIRKLDAQLKSATPTR